MKIDQCNESSFKKSIFLSENYLFISWLESKFSKLNKFEFWLETEAANFMKKVLWKISQNLLVWKPLRKSLSCNEDAVLR